MPYLYIKNCQLVWMQVWVLSRAGVGAGAVVGAGAGLSVCSGLGVGAVHMGSDDETDD